MGLSEFTCVFFDEYINPLRLKKTWICLMFANIKIKTNQVSKHIKTRKSSDEKLINSSFSPYARYSFANILFSFADIIYLQHILNASMKLDISSHSGTVDMK